MFYKKIRAAQKRNASFLCIGLDPDPDLLPTEDAFSFFRTIIEATSDLVCAYKPNLSFFEAMGSAGMDLLSQIMDTVPSELPTIGDGKRSDVPHAARFYAKAMFDSQGFDAAIVNPYLGSDALEPFLERKDRGVFLLCRTSNPGASVVQGLRLEDGRPLYLAIAELAQSWNSRGNLGLVVGATVPGELEQIRAICPGMTLLLPGVGAQGGDLAMAVQAAIDQNGEGFIISSSRQVIYASRGKDYAKRAREAAKSLRDDINRQRSLAMSSGEA